MNPIFLSLDEVIKIHHLQIEQYGGSHGLRDMGLLQSALAMPESGFGDQYLHEDLASMAAAYFFHLAQNHAFIDGNKRTAVAAALIFLSLKEQNTDFDEKELEELILKTASGQILKNEIASFFRARSPGTIRGDNK